MPAQVFGPEAAVSTLNRALNDQSPSNAVFKNQVSNAGTTEASINAFANTFLNNYKTLTDDALSTKVLTNMGLLPNAELQAALKDYFAANGAANRGIVVLQLGNILSGLENATGSLAVYSSAAAAWNNEVTGAYEYSQNPANTAPSTTGGNNVGTNFSLTANQDSVTGTGANDTFTAGVVNTGGATNINSLQSFDVVDGGAGTDTINVTLAQAATVAPTIKNIENINGRFTDAGAVLDLVGTTGLTSLIIADSTTAGQINNIAALAGLTINTQNTNVSVGGTAGSSTTLALNASTVGKSTALIGLDLGVNNASKVTTLNATLNGAYINLDSTNADVVTTVNATATGANALTLTDSKATVTKVVTSGAGSLDLSAVELSALTSFDGAASTGALKTKIYNAAKAVTITTGGGDDVVNLTGGVPVTGSSVTLGAGNDQVYTGTGLTGLDKGVNGGDGTDIINISNATALTSTTAKYVTNVETLDVSGGQGNYDVSLNSFATVQIDEAVLGALAAATSFTNAGKAFTLNVASKAKDADFATGQTVDVVLKDATGTTAKANAESFTLSAALNDGNADNAANGNINANTVTVAGVENLIVEANLKTVDGGSTGTKSSAHTLTVNFVAAAAETLTVKGDAKSIISGTGQVIGVINKVDATAASGGVQLDLTKATVAAGTIAYTGGDGVDTFSSGSGGSIVYGGKGSDAVTFIADGTQAVRDTYVLKASTDAMITDASKDGIIAITADAASLETLTNFKSGAAATDDRLDLTNFGFTGSQRGLADVSASVSGTTNLTSVTGLFSTPAGARGIAATTFGGDTYVLIDANKDGNFTAADDVIVKLVAVTALNEAAINF